MKNCASVCLNVLLFQLLHLQLQPSLNLVQEAGNTWLCPFVFAVDRPLYLDYLVTL